MGEEFLILGFLLFRWQISSFMSNVKSPDKSEHESKQKMETLINKGMKSFLWLFCWGTCMYTKWFYFGIFVFFLFKNVGVSKWLSCCSAVWSPHLPPDLYHHIARLQLHPLGHRHTNTYTRTHTDQLSPPEVEAIPFPFKYLALT